MLRRLWWAAQHTLHPAAHHCCCCAAAVCRVCFLFVCRFHGMAPSKNKQEQRQRKYLEEQAVARATSSENPSAGEAVLLSEPWQHSSIDSRLGCTSAAILLASVSSMPSSYNFACGI